VGLFYEVSKDSEFLCEDNIANQATFGHFDMGWSEIEYPLYASLHCGIGNALCGACGHGEDRNF
jgi:hypothetical protein